jgi:hypothetical protein
LKHVETTNQLKNFQKNPFLRGVQLGLFSLFGSNQLHQAQQMMMGQAQLWKNLGEIFGFSTNLFVC